MKKLRKLLIITSLTAMAIAGVVVIHSNEEEFPPFSTKL